MTRVPGALVTAKPPQHSQPAPLLPTARGLTPPTKRLLAAKSTEQLTEVLRAVMIELDTTGPTMKKYKKYLQKQTTGPNEPM